MAYSNWGAFVYKNGERQPNWEDQTPYKEDEYPTGWFEQAFFLGGEGEPIAPASIHHAVLGRQGMRLCGYKCWPVLFHRGEKIDLEPYCVSVGEDERSAAADADKPRTFEGQIGEYRFRAEETFNFVDLWLREPDGTVWTAKCGYEYGAGHEAGLSADGQSA